MSDVIFDEADLLERLGDDAELAAEVLAVFLDDAPVRRQAIDDALAQGDTLELRAAAHALKGAAGSIAAVRLYESSMALEHLANAGELAEAAQRANCVRVDLDELVAVLRSRSAAA